MVPILKDASPLAQKLLVGPSNYPKSRCVLYICGLQSHDDSINTPTKAFSCDSYRLPSPSLEHLSTPLPSSAVLRISKDVASNS